jgi:hypothetical protein
MHSTGRDRRPALRHDTPFIVHGNTDARLFRVATRLLSDLFLNGTARDRPLRQDPD